MENAVGRGVGVGVGAARGGTEAAPLAGEVEGEAIMLHSDQSSQGTPSLLDSRTGTDPVDRQNKQASVCCKQIVNDK